MRLLPYKLLANYSRSEQTLLPSALGIADWWAFGKVIRWAFTHGPRRWYRYLPLDVAMRVLLDLPLQWQMSFRLKKAWHSRPLAAQPIASRRSPAASCAMIFHA